MSLSLQSRHLVYTAAVLSAAWLGAKLLEYQSQESARKMFTSMSDKPNVQVQVEPPPNTYTPSQRMANGGYV